MDLLKQEFPNELDGQAQKYMAYINDSACRMRNLITGLLEYSRIGRNLEKSNVDCTNLVTTILTDLQHIIKESKATIQLEALPIVMGNETELRLLFQNLIHNAIKFHKHGTSPNVTISGKEEEKHFTIVISDQGIGINPAYTSKIFAIFQRLHSQTEFPGTGIGLAYCKKIVELMGGEIWVISEEGKGSSFYFTIPKEDGK